MIGALQANFSSVIRSTVIALGLTAAVSAHAGPLDVDFHWASADEVRAVTWTGFIINPDIGYEDLSIGGSGGRGRKDVSGVYGGGEVGYDKQIGSFVIGASASLYKSDISGGNGASFDLQLFGDVLGRVGYSFGRFMAYGTGGLSYGRFKIGTALGSDAKTLAGYAAGGGIEYVFNKSITIRAEYLHLDFGDASYSSLPIGANTVDPTIDSFSVGFVSRFGGDDYVPLK